MKKKIWTIGHSNKSISVFIEMLKSFNIVILADVRRYPGSKKFPHFNKAELKDALLKEGIEYLHFEDLGGRRKANPESINNEWKNEAFRGYADYMETEPFKKSVKELMLWSTKGSLAIMCSEALWWRCHRVLISDYLKIQDWTVLHIMGKGKTTEHPYSSAASVVQGKLDYSKKSDE